MSQFTTDCPFCRAERTVIVHPQRNEDGSVKRAAAVEVESSCWCGPAIYRVVRCTITRLLLGWLP